MCEYISHLTKFKKYKYTCKRETNNILNSEYPLSLLKDCLNLNTKNSYTIYVFYRTDKNIQSSVKLNLKKEKFNKKRLENFKSEIIQGSEGYLELYIFEDNDSNDKKQFNKLFSLIHEFCDINKISSDYDSNFTHSCTELVKEFLLDTYSFIFGKKGIVVLTISIAMLFTLQNTTLFNAGYPFETIDQAASLFLIKYIGQYVFSFFLLKVLVAILLVAYSFRLNKSKEQGNKNFKIIISGGFIIISVPIFFIIMINHKEIHESFLLGYNKIHVYPKLAKDSKDSYKLIMHDNMKKIYMYKLENLIDKNVTNIICKNINNYKTSTDLITAIMLNSEPIETKNIILAKSTTSLELLDENLSQSNIVETLCAKE